MPDRTFHFSRREELDNPQHSGVAGNVLDASQSRQGAELQPFGRLPYLLELIGR